MPNGANPSGTLRSVNPPGRPAGANVSSQTSTRALWKSVAYSRELAGDRLDAERRKPLRHLAVGEPTGPAGRGERVVPDVDARVVEVGRVQPRTCRRPSGCRTAQTPPAPCGR